MKNGFIFNRTMGEDTIYFRQRIHDDKHRISFDSYLFNY
jgi:hypothetical protein